MVLDKKVRKEILDGLMRSVVEFDRERVVELCGRALELGIDAYDAIMNGLAAGMEEAGELFNRKEYFVPEVLMCADALYAGLEVLRPHIGSDLRDRVKGQVVIGTVEGDIHDIGKNLVKIMFEVAGFTVHDLGRDVPLDRFVEEQLRTDSEVVCLSALMTTTMLGMPTVIKKIRAKNPKVKILVGGAPLTKELAEQFGADGYSPDAVNAVREAINMLSALRRLETSRGGEA